MRLALAFTFVVASCGGDDDGGGGGGAKPVIVKVAWTKAAGCVAGTRSSYNITTTASDADTPEIMLTYTGTLSSCTPSPWQSASASVSCPNLSSYSGSMTVKDPEGNTATKTFTVSPCLDGMTQ
jgi:hypothetical protein